jgi:hypothetical protein
MKTPTNDSLEASRRMIRDFGRHYEYDVSFLEELMDNSPQAFRAFEAAMPMARVARAAPAEAVFIVKIAAMRAQDCGPCTELNLKMAREAGVAENVIRGALHGGRGLTGEQRDLHDCARGVALGEELDPALLPRLQARWGGEAVAELAVNIVAAGIYPTLKRALGHAQSCSLFPALNP